MNPDSKILNAIIENLKTLNPYKIILFGSMSKIEITSNNDIDIYIVLNTDDLPLTYEDKMRYKIAVRNAILDISKKIPIDLIVHTKPMYEKFKNQNSLFSEEILTKGKVLYETVN